MARLKRAANDPAVVPEAAVTRRRAAAADFHTVTDRPVTLVTAAFDSPSASPLYTPQLLPAA